MINRQEPLLHWLQEFYATKIAPLKCRIGNSEIRPLLPEFISDEQIKDDYWCFQKVPETTGLLNINTLGNPGWSLRFVYYNIPHTPQNFAEISINTGENLIESDSDEWFCLNKAGDIFDIGSGPLYLTIVIEAFRSYIEQESFNITTLEETRAKLAPSSPLLEWLEDFFFAVVNARKTTIQDITYL